MDGWVNFALHPTCSTFFTDSEVHGIQISLYFLPLMTVLKILLVKLPMNAIWNHIMYNRPLNFTQGILKSLLWHHNSKVLILWCSVFAAVTELIFLGSKITTDGDCSPEMKRCLYLGRKVMPNLESILQNRDITFLTKVYIVKAMVSPVVMSGCKSWTIKMAERQRIDAFELWHWRRLLRVLWTARRSNQSILKEISPEYSLERLMPKL